VRIEGDIPPKISIFDHLCNRKKETANDGQRDGLITPTSNVERGRAKKE